MASLKRRPDEDFESYRHRRRVMAIIDKVKRVPRLIWNSKARGPFVWGKDELPNSLHEAHKRERIYKKAARKAEREATDGSA